MSIGAATSHNPPQREILRQMFGDNAQRCLTTGTATLPPQYVGVCPGATENDFSVFIDILIHKCLALTTSRNLSQWSQETLKTVRQKLDEVILKHQLTDDPLVSDLLKSVSKMAKYMQRGHMDLLRACAAVRTFLVNLIDHSATRIIDKEDPS